ncbi:MAG: serine hydrolase [Acidobacteriota bacterium]
MKRWTLALGRLLLVALLAALSAAPLNAAQRAPGERVPGEQWMQYVDPADAGFDAARLAAAKQQWQELPSSAFMVIADGAVVANWGETERRFMCHSVRKSFLSALFGIYWDRGEIELNKTMADVGIDEAGEGLLESEKQARILDLLKARSGVFHPAAYAGRTDSRPRGSEGPGRYFAYNNWDFNTLATVLEKETGASVFEAFDEHFGRPLAMQDWRVSDGYFHYERDKSIYPAYPFRMSARDAARIGLLFAREGMWGEQRILSRHWVRRSTALYSIDSDRFGYGFMWWVARESPLADHGFVAALGVGNQMIAVMPELDLVIVNRANTYRGERTPMDDLLDLIQDLLKARTGSSVPSPRLEPLASSGPDSDSAASAAETQTLYAELVGEWPYPPAPLGLPERTRVRINVEDGQLVTFSEVSGTFIHSLQSDGWLVEEDSLERFLPIRDANGAIAGISDATSVAMAAILEAASHDRKRAKRLLALLEEADPQVADSASVLVELFGNRSQGEKAARRWLAASDPETVQRALRRTGFQFFRLERPEVSQEIFALATRLFPHVSRVWETLGEAHHRQGHRARAIASFSKALELDPENAFAQRRLEALQEEAKAGDS